MKNYFQYLVIFFLLSGWASVSLSATGAGILSSEDAQTASPEDLFDEVAVFKSIREGLTLSVTQCALTSACDAATNSRELQQILNALDKRIEALSQRQLDTGDSAGLEDVLVAYVDERGGLSRILEKIDDSTSSVVEHIDDDELFDIPAAVDRPLEDGTAETVTETTGNETAEQLDDMFADEDEEL